MIKPRIESIETLFGDSLDSVIFDDADNFEISVRALIGPHNQAGEESFDVSVCSYDWLLSELRVKGYLFVSKALVIERWDANLVDSVIREHFSRLSGKDWHELADKLAAFSAWEFENYRENPDAV